MKKIERILIKFILSLVVHIAYRVKIAGRENVPEKGGAILCGNHIHALDPVVIVLLSKRQVFGLAKEELYRFWIIRWLANIFGMYPVKRDGSDISAVKISLKILKENGLLLIAPEGTRNGMAKGLKPRNGPVNIAVKSGVPIVPIGITGSFKVFSRITYNYRQADIL